MKTFNELINKAATWTKPSIAIPCNTLLSVGDENWTAYEVSIAHRELLFFTDKGTATVVVDSYGDRHVGELFDWECDQ